MLIGNNFRKEKIIKLYSILLIISIGSMSKYGGVPYDLNNINLIKKKYQFHIELLAQW